METEIDIVISESLDLAKDFDDIKQKINYSDWYDNEGALFSEEQI